MDTRSRSLPVEVQHHLNAKLYGALPLCVVLGHKAHRWFQHRFVQLCGYQFESQPQTRVFDFCDSFAYTELLRPQRIERAVGEQLALTEFLLNSIDTGKYPIVMVDNTMLTGTVPPSGSSSSTVTATLARRCTSWVSVRIRDSPR